MWYCGECDPCLRKEKCGNCSACRNRHWKKKCYEMKCERRNHLKCQMKLGNYDGRKRKKDTHSQQITKTENNSDKGSSNDIGPSSKSSTITQNSVVSDGPPTKKKKWCRNILHKEFKCPYCSMVHKSLPELRVHLQVHHFSNNIIDQVQSKFLHFTIK